MIVKSVHLILRHLENVELVAWKTTSIKKTASAQYSLDAQKKKKNLDVCERDGQGTDTVVLE